MRALVLERMSCGGAAIPIQTDAERRTAEWLLVRRAQDGDVAAFERLYRENVNRVYALSFRLTGEAGRAEELAQDVFVRAWQKIGSFRGESAFSSWLFPLTLNLAFSARRVSRRESARTVAAEDLPPLEDKAPRGTTPDLEVDLERAVAALPPGARSVFVLHDVEGYQHEEIGRMMGVAVGTSKAQLHRARRLLRKALGR